MLKKIVSIILVVVMVFSVAVISVSADVDTDNSAEVDNIIYFDATGWKNFNTVYCHIWVRGDESFFAWQAKRELCTKVKDNLYSYDLSVLDSSPQFSGGLKDNVDYCVIFSANTGVQTYETTFGTPCIGDTAKLTGKQIEHPFDYEKSVYEAVWTTNSAKYGPHLALSSIGNITGSVLCPNESGIYVIGNWLPIYCNSSYMDVTAILVKAFPQFGVKTADDIKAIYEYIVAENIDKHPQYCFDDMKKILNDAFMRAYPSAGEVVTNSTTENTEPTTEATEPTTEPMTEVTEPVESEPEPTEPATKPVTKAKKANKMKVTVVTKTVKTKKLKRAKLTVKAITVNNNNGKVKFSKVAKKSSSRLTVNAKTGKITVKRGTKKGNYKIKVKVYAKGTKYYKSKTVTKTVTIKVR